MTLRRAGVRCSQTGGYTAAHEDWWNKEEDERHGVKQDLREDVSRLFRSYDLFVRGRAYLEDLKENLAARNEWLEKNAAENPAAK